MVGCRSPLRRARRASTRLPIHPAANAAFRLDAVTPPPSFATYEQPRLPNVGGAAAAATEWADSFVMTEAATIKRILWWGGYAPGIWWDLVVGRLLGHAQLPAAWRRRLHNPYLRGQRRAAWPPVLVTYTFGDQVFRTLTGESIWLSYGDQIPEFFYSTALPAPLTLEANTGYWISINTPSYGNTGFGWEDAEGTGAPGVYISANDPVLGPWMFWGPGYARMSFKLDR